MILIAALFVEKNGPYFGIPFIDPWDKSRDARKYEGPYPVIAHPPCERWGRYWSGGPSAKKKRILGDDQGCFERALHFVRTYGGVLEHPEASHAFKVFNLPIPDFNGGWTSPDFMGGQSCCVAQGHYGHLAQKMTWLYAVSFHTLPELKWGRAPNRHRLDLGFHSKEERKRTIKTGIVQRLSKKQRLLTPINFRDQLISIAKKTQPLRKESLHV